MKAYEIYHHDSFKDTRVLVVSSKEKALFFIKAKFAESGRSYKAVKGFIEPKWSYDEKETLTKKEILNDWHYITNPTESYFVKKVEIL